MIILTTLVKLQSFLVVSATNNTPLFVHSASRHLRRRPTRIFTTTSTSTHTKNNPAFQFKNRESASSMNASADPSPDASLYNSFASAAVDITEAYVSNNVLTFVRSARDIDDNQRRKFLHHILLNNGNDSIALPPTELSSNIKARIPSPSGNKIAIFTKDKNNKQNVEIWTSKGTLSRKISLPKTLHGDVCTDTSWFGSFSWNAGETAIVYSAEMNPPATKSFFDKEDGKEEKAVIGATNTLGYGKGEHWGEKYTNTCRLNIYVLQVDTGKCALVENVPGGDELSSTDGGYSLGQPTFSPDGNHIVYTAWDAGAGGNMSKRLGSIYCYQRHCAIYSSPIHNLLKGLSTDSDTATGPMQSTAASSPSTADLALAPKIKADASTAASNASSKNFIVAPLRAVQQLSNKRIVVAPTPATETETATTDPINAADGDYTCLTPDDRLARSPRFVVVGEDSSSKLVWLSNAKGFDTHGGCVGLHSFDWDGDTGANMDARKVLVVVVNLPEEEDFPGLFVNQLPTGSFVSADGEYLYTTTQWRSITKVVKISMSTGEIHPIVFNLNSNEKESKTMGSQSLLCITNTGAAIVAQSEPNTPPVIGYLPSSSLLMGGEGNVPSSVISQLGPIAATSSFAPQDLLNGEGKLSYHVIRTYPPHGNVKAPVEGILLLPSESKDYPVPLIVVPHGGPHSCSSTSYIPSYAYLCQGGKYGILHTNYRGSSGFGQAALESLAGNVGTQDVEDVVHLTNHVLEEFKDRIDPSCVGVCGGSHGGFLSGHLIGQYPELFKVAAMRNPVTNIATMTTATDIPDWCYVESLGPGKYDWTKVCALITFVRPVSYILRLHFD